MAANTVGAITWDTMVGDPPPLAEVVVKRVRPPADGLGLTPQGKRGRAVKVACTKRVADAEEADELCEDVAAQVGAVVSMTNAWNRPRAAVLVGGETQTRYQPIAYGSGAAVLVTCEYVLERVE